MTDERIDTMRYTYRATWSNEDDKYVATCLEFPSLSWLANSPEVAVRGLCDVIAEVLQDLSTDGEPVPEQLAELGHNVTIQPRGAGLSRQVTGRLKWGQDADHRRRRSLACA